MSQCCRIILDSGAGLHLCPTVVPDDFNSTVMVSGFNGSVSPTRGTTLPCIFTDADSGQEFSFNLHGVHNYDGERTLISFGLLIKNDFTFEARSADDLWLFTPCRQHAICVVIGGDNIMYLPCKPGNNTCHYANKHTMKQATYHLLHCIHYQSL